MNSREALERLWNYKGSLGYDDSYDPPVYCGDYPIFGEELEVIEKDLDRLEKLKNLEEELGIDLITLFKALKDGIFALNDDYECVSGLVKIIGREIDLNLFLKRLEVKFVGCWNLSDYKKTWALTREELENDTKRND